MWQTFVQKVVPFSSETKQVVIGGANRNQSICFRYIRLCHIRLKLTVMYCFLLRPFLRGKRPSRTLPLTYEQLYGYDKLCNIWYFPLFFFSLSANGEDLKLGYGGKLYGPEILFKESSCPIEFLITSGLRLADKEFSEVKFICEPSNCSEKPFRNPDII